MGRWAASKNSSNHLGYGCCAPCREKQGCPKRGVCPWEKDNWCREKCPPQKKWQPCKLECCKEKNFCKDGSSGRHSQALYKDEWQSDWRDSQNAKLVAKNLESLAELPERNLERNVARASDYVHDRRWAWRCGLPCAWKRGCDDSCKFGCTRVWDTAVTHRGLPGLPAAKLAKDLGYNFARRSGAVWNDKIRSTGAYGSWS